MKTLKITYQRENGSTDIEIVEARNGKLTKSIHNYFIDINALILNIEICNI